jgi:hypothetical protein
MQLSGEEYRGREENQTSNDTVKQPANRECLQAHCLQTMSEDDFENLAEQVSFHPFLRCALWFSLA